MTATHHHTDCAVSDEIDEPADPAMGSGSGELPESEADPDVTVIVAGEQPDDSVPFKLGVAEANSQVEVIADTPEPVAQVFVDDVGRRRRLVATGMNLGKSAMVLYAGLVAYGVVQVAWAQADGYLRPVADIVAPGLSGLVDRSPKIFDLGNEPTVDEQALDEAAGPNPAGPERSATSDRPDGQPDGSKDPAIGNGSSSPDADERSVVDRVDSMDPASAPVSEERAEAASTRPDLSPTPSNPLSSKPDADVFAPLPGLLAGSGEIGSSDLGSGSGEPGQELSGQSGGVASGQVDQEVSGQPGGVASGQADQETSGQAGQIATDQAVPSGPAAESPGDLDQTGGPDLGDSQRPGLAGGPESVAPTGPSRPLPTEPGGESPVVEGSTAGELPVGGSEAGGTAIGDGRQSNQPDFVEGLPGQEPGSEKSGTTSSPPDWLERLPEEAGSRPDDAGSRPGVAGSGPEEAGSRPGVAGSRPDGAGSDPTGLDGDANLAEETPEDEGSISEPPDAGSISAVVAMVRDALADLFDFGTPPRGGIGPVGPVQPSDEWFEIEPPRNPKAVERLSNNGRPGDNNAGSVVSDPDPLPGSDLATTDADTDGGVVPDADADEAAGVDEQPVTGPEVVPDSESTTDGSVEDTAPIPSPDPVPGPSPVPGPGPAPVPVPRPDRVPDSFPVPAPGPGPVPAPLPGPTPASSPLDAGIDS